MSHRRLSATVAPPPSGAAEAVPDVFPQAADPLTYAQLRALPDDELVRRYDFVLQRHRVTPADYAHEVQRRELKHHSGHMRLLTAVIAWLTLLIAAFTAVLEISERL